MKVDDYQRWAPATQCLSAPGPGVEAVRDFVVARFGGEDLGIMRACGAGGASSLHNEGRAWDWGTVRRPAQVPAMIAWLMGPGPDGKPHYWIRRLGIVSVIWDRRIWSTTYKKWRPYTGVDPHTTHIHIGFSRRGADALTSGYVRDMSGTIVVDAPTGSAAGPSSPSSCSEGPAWPSTPGEGGAADTEPGLPAIDQTIAAVRGLASQPAEFIVALWHECAAAGLEADWVAAVMSFETGGTFSPTIRPPQGSAVGLLQWTTVGADAQGTTVAQIARMSQLTQLRLAIERFRMFPASQLVTVADYYMSVFAPKYVGRSDDVAMYVNPSRAYRFNRLLDDNGDGKITKGEAAEQVEDILSAAKLEPRIDVANLVPSR
mgnify:CR=1 FL=1